MVWNHPWDSRGLKPLLGKLLTWWLRSVIGMLWR
jgi:hypothetical protein